MGKDISPDGLRAIGRVRESWKLKGRGIAYITYIAYIAYIADIGEMMGIFRVFFVFFVFFACFRFRSVECVSLRRLLQCSLECGIRWDHARLFLFSHTGV